MVRHPLLIIVYTPILVVKPILILQAWKSKSRKKSPYLLLILRRCHGKIEMIKVLVDKNSILWTTVLFKPFWFDAELTTS
jgi:hypothetical protein